MSILDLNCLDQQGRNALMLASLNGHYGIVEVLLENTDQNLILNLNATDLEGKTAMALAKENGHKPVVKLLRKYRFQQRIQRMRRNIRLFFRKIRNQILELLW